MKKKINWLVLFSAVIPVMGLLIVNNKSLGIERLWGIGLIGVEFVILAILFSIKLREIKKDEK